MPSTPENASRISAIGWLRIAGRLAVMALWLLACIVLRSAWRIARAADNPWPRRFLAGIAALAGVRIATTGQPAAGGVIFLANHVSWIDIPALAGASGTAFVAHDGLASVPLLRWLCEMNDTVFIARHDRASVARQVAQVHAAIRDTGALTIFPEGTTSDGTTLLPLKSALLSAVDPIPDGIAVQPVLLDYGAQAPAIAWVGEEPGLDNFLKILARSAPVHLTLHFLPPLAGDALTNRKTMANAAHAAILGAMSRVG